MAFSSNLQRLSALALPLADQQLLLLHWTRPYLSLRKLYAVGQTFYDPASIRSDFDPAGGHKSTSLESTECNDEPSLAIIRPMQKTQRNFDGLDPTHRLNKVEKV